MSQKIQPRYANVDRANQTAGVLLAARVRVAKYRMGTTYLCHPENRVAAIVRGPVRGSP